METLTVMALNLQVERPQPSPLEKRPARPDPSERRKQADDDFEKSLTQQSRAISISEPPRDEPQPTNDDLVREPSREPPPEDASVEPDAETPAVPTETETKSGQNQADAVFQLISHAEADSVKTLPNAAGLPEHPVQTTSKLTGQEIEARSTDKPITLTKENLSPSTPNSEKNSAVTLQSQPPPVPSASASPAAPSGLLEITQSRKHVDKSLTNLSAPDLANSQLLQTPTALADTATFTPVQSIPTPPAWQSALLNPGEILDQVRIQLLTGAKTGEKRISVQMQPPELGKLNIELSLNDKQIEARIYTEHQAVREVVLSQLEQLRAQLSQEGWTLGKVDVNIGTFREQQDQKSFEGTSFGRFGRGGGHGLNDTQTVSEPTVREWRPPGLGARINVIV